MDTLDRLAALLLVFMPFSFAAKSIAVTVALTVMRTQRPKYDLGVFIFRFFVALALTSWGLTWMFGRLAWVFHDAQNLSPWLLFMGIVEVASSVVAYYGARMVQAARRLPIDLPSSDD